MYTIPEQERALRHDLRKRLRFLGFTTLHAATWVTPRDRTSNVRGLLDELTAEEHADVFVGLPDRPQRLAHDIRESWELGQLQAGMRTSSGASTPSGDRACRRPTVMRSSCARTSCTRSASSRCSTPSSPLMDQAMLRGQAVRLSTNSGTACPARPDGTSRTCQRSGAGGGWGWLTGAVT
jgi:hypothetical protein